MTKKETKKQSGNFGARLVAVFMAVLIIVGLICAAGYGSKNAAGAWFKNGDITTWFNSWGKGNKTDPVEPSKPDESSFLVRAQYNVGDPAAFAATPYADDGNNVYLTILTDPVETDDTFTWTSSDTSCVIVTPSDDGRSATVTCLQAFSEQITVEAISNETGLKAVATCDFVKRVQTVTLSVSPEKVNFGTASAVYSVEVNAVFGVGTITPEISTSNGKFQLDTQNGAITLYGMDDDGSEYWSARLYELTFTGSSFTISDAGSFMQFSVGADGLASKETQYRAEAVQQLNAELKYRYENSGLKTATVSVDYSTTYGGKVYNSGSLNTTVALDISGLRIYSSQPSFDKPGVIF